MVTFIHGEVGQQSIDRETLIIVEGKDDALFLDRILSDLGASPDEISVCVVGGISKFKDFLRAIKQSSPFRTGKIRRYAIIRDADDKLEKSIAESAKYFTLNGEPAPSSGAFVTNGTGQVASLFLVPASGATGDLESLCMDSVAGSDLHKLVEQHYLNSIGVVGELDHRSKRMAQIYLAAASRPLARGVGSAFRAGTFDIGSPVLQPLKDYLKAFLASVP